MVSDRRVLVEPPGTYISARYDRAMNACGHPLCELVGDGDCSLARGVSRGCRTGPRVAPPFAPALVDEVAELVGQLAAGSPPRSAAVRLAFLFRREARSDRSLLGLATDELLEPALAQRLVELCRRRA
jgi:hypothetical protein